MSSTDWIKIRTALPDEPEVIAMSKELGIDIDLVVGKLVRLWSWADCHVHDGTAKGVDFDFLNAFLKIDLFAEAMEKVGWLTLFRGSIKFVNYDRHMSKCAKKRALQAQRMAKKRAQNVRIKSAQKTHRKRTENAQMRHLDKIREDKRREEKMGEEEKNPQILKGNLLNSPSPNQLGGVQGGIALGFSSENPEEKIQAMEVFFAEVAKGNIQDSQANRLNAMATWFELCRSGKVKNPLGCLRKRIRDGRLTEYSDADETKASKLLKEHLHEEA